MIKPVVQVSKPIRVQVMLPLEGIVVGFIVGLIEVLAVMGVLLPIRVILVVSVGLRSVPIRVMRGFRIIVSRT